MNDCKQHYAEQGYVVFEDLIPESFIDSVLAGLESVKRKKFVYYSQSVHRWITPSLSESGFLIDSMENPTWHLHLPALRSAAMRILYHPKVSDALMQISDVSHFISWQDMLFDRSVGTIDHQDSWYLDTLPYGRLIAGWFALEDIHPDSGPFFVYPGSHLLPRIGEKEYPAHTDFLAAIKDIRDKSGIEKKPMPLRKGSVLFWHPNLIHGADLVRDERYSRKSLTSHYYPVGLMRKDSTSLLEDLQQMKPTDNARMFRKGFPELSWVLKGHGYFLKDQILRDLEPIMNMRREGDTKVAR